jgi:hypothetical protein
LPVITESLILLIAILRILMEKEVKKGEVLSLCFGALGCALALIVLVAGAPVVNKPSQAGAYVWNMMLTYHS